ncbi:MAG: hypothetical protein U0Q22_05200 [Acidimicrobiales bacterium]
MSGLFLPTSCVVCRSVGSPLCEACAATLQPAPEVEPGERRDLGLDRVVALFAYEGAGATVIKHLKFGNHRDALRPLAHALAAAVDTHVDLVTWVPTSTEHRRRRGYDQAELVARTVGRSLGVRTRSTVRRVDPTAQTGRHRSERLTARFEAIRPLSTPVVAVVDDVRTTGGSLAGVAHALRRAGAERVVGATLAATPRSVHASRSFPLQSWLTNGTPSRFPPVEGNRRQRADQRERPPHRDHQG